MSYVTRIINWKFIVLLSLLVIMAALFLRTPEACQETMTYRIGRVDDRFGLTREEFALAVNMAAAMWGKPKGKELFREDTQGIEINLVYDYRQEASDKLKKLNFKIENTRTSYDDLRARLDSLKTDYDQKNAGLTSDFNLYNARVSTLNANTEYWNRRGGVTETIHNKLVQEKGELGSLREKLKTREDDLRRIADTINSMVVVMNEIAANINIDAADYRNTGNALGREFCEGYYETKNGKQTINIYQFDNDYRLVRVLAHELGHALGLNHSADPRAVMYRLNQSDAIELSQDDISALRRRCQKN